MMVVNLDTRVKCVTQVFEKHYLDVIDSKHFKSNLEMILN